MATTNYDAADLDTAESINEDVMQQIFDISPVETPFTNAAGTEDATNQYTEWTLDSLAAPDYDNAVVDGADAGTDDSASTTRVGNHCQILDKVLRVSGRARAVNTIGRSDELAYQLLQRGKEIRRDVEAIAIGNQASVADNGSTTAGRMGSVVSWLETNTDRGSGGSDGGFSSGTVGAATAGTARALTEAGIRGVIQNIYNAGGNPGMIMLRPIMKQRMSEYLFTSSARVGTITTQTQGQNQSVAIGAVDVFVSDFGVLQIVPNRFMLDYNDQDTHGNADESDVLILDMMFWAMSFLRGYRTEPLAKAGDADNRQILVDLTVCSKNEAASGVFADVDETTAMTA